MCCEAQDQRVHARHHDGALRRARALRRRRARGVSIPSLHLINYIIRSYGHDGGVTHAGAAPHSAR